MSKEVRHLELFAGIGGFRKAIDLYCGDYSLVSKCVGFSEVDKYAVNTYKANYETFNEVELGDIKAYTSEQSSIEALPDFDLLTGGFPCQAFSMMGKKKGFQDDRGNLFYSIIDIILVKKPKYVFLENVRNIKTHDKGRTYKEIIRSLEEDAGYKVWAEVFNTSNFGLPQHRRRMFFIAVRNDLVNQEIDNFILKESDVIQFYEDKVKNKGSLYFYDTVLDGILDKEVEEKYYLSERIKPTILSNGSKNFKSRSEINQMIARPLTATMVKMHRACQDNYYSDGFLNSKNPTKYLEHQFSKEEEATHRIRKLTPVEALKLQGFNESFYDRAVDAKVSNHQLYRQAGNAVSVNTVYTVLAYLREKNIFEY